MILNALRLKRISPHVFSDLPPCLINRGDFKDPPGACWLSNSITFSLFIKATSGCYESEVKRRRAKPEETRQHDDTRSAQ